MRGWDESVQGEMPILNSLRLRAENYNDDTRNRHACLCYHTTQCLTHKLTLLLLNYRLV